MRPMYSIPLAVVARAFALIPSPEELESPRMEAIVVARAVPHPIESHGHCESCHGPKGRNR